MATNSKKLVLRLVKQLENDANGVVNTGRVGGAAMIDMVDQTRFFELIAGCVNLLRMLGNSGEAWQVFFKLDNAIPHSVHAAMKAHGALKAIEHAIEHDLLLRVEELVAAEMFDDLLEQADYLLANGYFLAAGVLGRAVLEERLRNWCGSVGCVPAKAKPTLNDFSSELYKNQHIDKVMLKHVEAMAAIGNDAAHNLPTLTREAVERLVRDVRKFLIQNP